VLLFPLLDDALARLRDADSARIAVERSGVLNLGDN